MPTVLNAWIEERELLSSRKFKPANLHNVPTKRRSLQGNRMQLMNMSQQQTMSSREIADLVEKRHDNVKRTITSLVNAGVISQPQIEDGKISANGIVEMVYEVGKRDSYIIVAQLSPEFTARLVDRWQELENVAAKVITKELTRLEILEMVLLSERDNIKLRAEVEAAKPAVEFVERYVESGLVARRRRMLSISMLVALR